MGEELAWIRNRKVRLLSLPGFPSFSLCLFLFPLRMVLVAQRGGLASGSSRSTSDRVVPEESETCLTLFSHPRPLFVPLH